MIRCSLVLGQNVTSISSIFHFYKETIQRIRQALLLFPVIFKDRNDLVKRISQSKYMQLAGDTNLKHYCPFEHWRQVCIAAQDNNA